MIRVLLESPFAAESVAEAERNRRYLVRAIRDCFGRGEAPFASHALYTIALDDDIPNERELGIEAGLLWGECACKSVVYVDHGISPGMQKGINRAHADGRDVEFREIGKEPVLVPLGVAFDVAAGSGAAKWSSPTTKKGIYDAPSKRLSSHTSPKSSLAPRRESVLEECGMDAAYDAAVAKVDREGCETCDGAGDHNCFNCEGFGFKVKDGGTCQDCDGTGLAMCKDCNGYGTVVVSK